MDLYLFPFNVYLALSSQRNNKNNRTSDLYVGETHIIRRGGISDAMKIASRCQSYVDKDEVAKSQLSTIIRGSTFALCPGISLGSTMTPILK